MLFDNYILGESSIYFNFLVIKILKNGLGQRFMLSRRVHKCFPKMVLESPHFVRLKKCFEPSQRKKKITIS